MTSTWGLGAVGLVGLLAVACGSSSTESGGAGGARASGGNASDATGSNASDTGGQSSGGDGPSTGTTGATGGVDDIGGTATGGLGPNGGTAIDGGTGGATGGAPPLGGLGGVGGEAPTGGMGGEPVVHNPGDDCTGDVDCQPSAMVCYSPYQRVPSGTGGSPPQFECAADDDCSDELICVYVEQSRLCRAPCPTTRCDPAQGQECGPDGRCRTVPCSIDSDCPTNFACDVDGGFCERASCSAGPDCPDTSFCVNGFCYESPGRCNYTTAA